MHLLCDAQKNNEPTRQVRDNVVEKFISGFGCKISQALNIPKEHCASNNIEMKEYQAKV